MTQKCRKRDLRDVKPKTFPRGACSQTPLEACAFGGSQSQFTLDRRLNVNVGAFSEHLEVSTN